MGCTLLFLYAGQTFETQPVMSRAVGIWFKFLQLGSARNNASVSIILLLALLLASQYSAHCAMALATGQGIFCALFMIGFDLKVENTGSMLYS